MNTIAAISTPYGKGGVAVIRISGDEAFGVSEKCFKPEYRKSISDYAMRHAIYGSVIKDDIIIDKGVLCRYNAPNSFTGENMVEISCHGGIQITSMVLESVLCEGAALAGPGEFTKRAFLNGKLSLTQAEAVAELLDAKSEAAAILSQSQLSGKLTEKINDIYNTLVRLVSTLYASIDYPEEDLEDMSDTELENELTKLCEKAEVLKKSYKIGRAVTGGVDTVIVGKPNAGKSSIFNLLAGEERAIVTDIPGTTRDIIDVCIKIGAIMLNLRDTAGIRDDATDTVEKIGIDLSLDTIYNCELILAVFDGAKKLDSNDYYVIDQLKKCNKTTIALINKSDKKLLLEIDQIPFDMFNISAISGEGIENLKEKIEKLYDSEKISLSDGGLITNARQFSNISKTAEKLSEALYNLRRKSKDMCGMILENALSILGEIDGRAVDEEIVNSIFSRFCVGK